MIAYPMRNRMAARSETRPRTERRRSPMSTTPVPDEIRKEVTIEVERERVWAALTEADQLKGWFPTKDARVDLRPGGELFLDWGDMSATGTFDEIDPPNR